MTQSFSRQGFFIVMLFFIIYLFSFNGIPISDDEELFATTARNIATFNNLSAEPLYGNIRYLGIYTVEPLHPLLASVWYRTFKLFLNNGLQIFFLLPVIYISISIGLLFILIVRFGYSHQFALEMVFWCGLSTIVWPYTKTFFREPLLIMLLLASWVFFEKTFTHGRINKFYLTYLLITILCLALTKLIYAAIVIPYTVMLFQRLKNLPDGRKIGFLFIVLTLFLAGASIYIAYRNNTILYRYTLPALLEYRGRISSISQKDFFTTAFASLFSLWKGFFIYSPLCLFLFLLPWAETKLNKKIYLLFLPMFVFFSALLYQLITYGDNPWTPPWSVRFLVPSVPLILVACLPALAHFYKSPWGRRWIRMVGITGVLIQLNAILTSPATYHSILMEKSPAFPVSEYWNIWSAPAFHQWQLLLDDYPINLMIFRVINEKGSLPACLLLLCGIILISVLLAALFLGRLEYIFPFTLEIGILSITTLILFFYVLGQDPFYTELNPLVEQVCQQINPNLTKDSLVILQPYPSTLWQTFVNRDCLHGNWYSLPEDKIISSTTLAYTSMKRLLDGAEAPFSKIWLVRQKPDDNVFVKEVLPSLYPFKKMGMLDDPIHVELFLYEKK